MCDGAGAPAVLWGRFAAPLCWSGSASRDRPQRTQKNRILRQTCGRALLICITAGRNCCGWGHHGVGEPCGDPGGGSGHPVVIVQYLGQSDGAGGCSGRVERGRPCRRSAGRPQPTPTVRPAGPGTSLGIAGLWPSWASCSGTTACLRGVALCGFGVMAAAMRFNVVLCPAACCAGTGAGDRL